MVVEKDPPSKKDSMMPDISDRKTDGKNADDGDDDFKPAKVKRAKARPSIQYEGDGVNDEEKENVTTSPRKGVENAGNYSPCKRGCCEDGGKPLTEEQRQLFKMGATKESRPQVNKKDAKKDDKTDAKKEINSSSSSSPQSSIDFLPKIYFGTRTHKQISQIVREFKKTEYSRTKMTILASREHTCIEPEVSRSRNKNEGCNEKLRQRKRGNREGGCDYYEDGHRVNHRVLTSNGFGCGWDLEDLIRFGRRHCACPFFTTKALRDDAEIIFCPYNYLIDPFIRSQMEINLNGHVVILDEAHNMEDTAR